MSKQKKHDEMSEAEETMGRISKSLAKITSKEQVSINVDIGQAATIALGALPKIEMLRGRLEKLPDFDISILDKLADFAWGVWYASSEAGSSAHAAFETTVEVATERRKDLSIALRPLVHKGIVPEDRLSEIRGGRGHIDLATDMQFLCATFRKYWAKIENRSTVSKADLEQAEELTSTLVQMLADRGNQRTIDQTGDISDPMRLRSKAFTALVKAYDQVRRAVSYVRWDEGDAEEIAPSLYSRRKVSRNERAEPEAETPEVETPEVLPAELVQPVAGPTNGTVPHGPSPVAQPVVE